MITHLRLQCWLIQYLYAFRSFHTSGRQCVALANVNVYPTPTPYLTCTVPLCVLHQFNLHCKVLSLGISILLEVLVKVVLQERAEYFIGTRNV